MYKAYIVLTQKLLFCTVCITLFSCKDSDYVDHEFHHLIASIEEKQLIAEDRKWFRAYRVKPERIDAELQKTYSGYEGWQKFTRNRSLGTKVTYTAPNEAKVTYTLHGEKDEIFVNYKKGSTYSSCIGVFLDKTNSQIIFYYGNTRGW